jgi:hypothetical protein
MQFNLRLALGILLALSGLGEGVTERPLPALALPGPAQPRPLPPIKLDYGIMPDRVGNIRKTTSREQLTAIFGAANLEDYTAHGPEGDGDFPATKLLHNGNMALSIVWQDNRRQAISIVRIYDSRWHTAEGLAVGTPVSQLRRMFGEFKFYGFEWDYGGLLSNNTNLKLEQYRKAHRLSFDLVLPKRRCQQFPTDCRALLGEQLIVTTNPHLKSVDPEIGSISALF